MTTIDSHPSRLSYRTLVSNYKKSIQDRMSANPLLKPYMVTTRLKRIDISRDEFRSDYPFFGKSVWDTYGRVYIHLVSQLTNNFSRKPSLQPLTFDFLDVNGTKENKTASFTSTTKPHVHSIYLVHQAVQSRFEQLIQSGFYSIIEHPSMRDTVASIDAKHVHDLSGAVSYASKFFDNYQAKGIREEYYLFNQHPIPKFERAPPDTGVRWADMMAELKKKPAFGQNHFALGGI